MTTMSEQKAVTAIREHIGSRTLVLVGLMGAGKSAIGRKLAQKLGFDFVDADIEIEKAAKQTIAEIFETYGEDEFRRVEERVIARILTNGPQVLATGGGAFMNENTRAKIAQSGISLWLSADIDLLMERVSKRSTRPLLKKPNPRAIMQDLIDTRYPIYAMADIEVTSRNVSKDEMGLRVLQAYATYLSQQNGTDA